MSSKTTKTIQKIGKKIKKAVETAQKNLYYNIKTYCYNCGHTGQNKIPKGIKRKEGLKYVRCDNCGCIGTLTIKR